jgi:hypothetical protein
MTLAAMALGFSKSTAANDVSSLRTLKTKRGLRLQNDIVLQAMVPQLAELAASHLKTPFTSRASPLKQRPARASENELVPLPQNNFP